VLHLAACGGRLLEFAAAGGHPRWPAPADPQPRHL